jgi:hypothetical protein
VRFLLSVVLFTASIALSILNIAIPHTQAASTPAPTCTSAIPPLVAGTPVPAPLAPGTLFINEVLPNPATAWNCADLSPSSRDAWIELYNAQSQPVDLSSSHAEINIGSAAAPFPLPNPSVIAPFGFLVIFPLSSTSALTITSVQLIIAGTVIDSISIPTLQPDQSYARIPDGKNGIWQLSNYPTIGAPNSLTPPLPTPTPTKVKQTSTKTSKTRHSSASSQTSHAQDSSTTRTVASEGTQPAWNELQLPVGTAALPVAQATDTPTSTTPQPATETSDLPQKIMISISVLAVAGTLFWCWKRFLSP